MGLAEKLSGKPAAATEALTKALATDPEGPWSGKIRFEQAVLELSAGRPAEAESLAKAEVESLLGDRRKDRLAGMIRDFALKLLDPKDPLIAPDPNAAHDLSAQARELAKGNDLAAKLLFEMAKASQAGGQLPRASEEYQAYIREYPKGVDRDEARFHAAEVELALGQSAQARIRWADLARDLKSKNDPPARDLRARSLFQIALSHGMPAPGDDAEYHLGAAALLRFLEDAPEHDLAVRAAYWLGLSAANRGKSDVALAQLKAFLAGDRYRAVSEPAAKEKVELSMQASMLVGSILQGQEKFEAAIDAWKSYLAQYPNGRDSAAAQRGIIDTEFLIAQHSYNHKNYAKARDAFASFVIKNPLDPRAPEALFLIGQSHFDEKKYDQAIAEWETLAGRFPGGEPASHGEFSIASTLETVKGDLAAAIDRYRKVAVEPWLSQARVRIAVMESKSLAVITPRAFRSSETPALDISTRNLEKLTFSAYKLDAEAYFRKKLQLGAVEGLDIGLVAPDAEWTEEIPGQAKYKPIKHDYPLAKLQGPGVWVVKVGDEKNLQAETLVITSDIDAIIKSSRDQILVFVQDMKTGKGRPGARVVISAPNAPIFEAKTGPDGVLLHNWDKPRDPAAGPFRVMALDQAHVASTGLSIPGKVAQGLSARAFVFTDRPAYRPGQDVELKGVVREVKDGQYASPAGTKFRVIVADAKGRAIFNQELALSPYGTFWSRFALDSTAPLGVYSVHVSRPGFADSSGNFQVQAYQLEKIDLRFDIPKSVVFRGDKVEADVIAKYQYGTPLAGRPIEVALPDGRMLSGVTDAAGKYHVSLETTGFGEEQPLPFTARLPNDNVAASGIVMLAVRGFSIALATPRDLYLDGETFALAVTAADALGKPIGVKLKASVIKRITEAGRITEREIDARDLGTDSKTGRASIPIKIDDGDGGSFVVRVSGFDQFTNPIVAERLLTISGKKDPARLRIISDAVSFRSGSTAKVNLHARDQAGSALVTWEGDKILAYKIVSVNVGDNDLSWRVDPAQSPNFTLSAARMTGNRLDSASLDIRVERELKVSIKPAKAQVAPGEEVEIEVRTTDQLDRPVAAEVALVMVDRALLRLFEADNGSRASMASVFYNQTRTGSFAVESTNTFHYNAATSKVPDAIVEEADRAAAELADKEAKDRLQLDKTYVSAAQNTTGLAIEGAPPAAAGMGFAGGAMAPASAATPMLREAAKNGEMMGRRSFNRGAVAKSEAMSSRRLGGRGGAAGKPADAKADQMRKEVRDLADFADVELQVERAAGADAPARRRFVETAYWNPSIVTNASGVAKIRFKAPSALSNYRLDSWAVTAETLVGQAGADLEVKKPFLVDLKLPPAFTQGDKPGVMAEVHHSGLVGTLELTLKVYANQREEVFPRTIEVKEDGVERIAFEPFEVPDGDVVRFSLSGKCKDASDSLVIEVPIRSWGVQAVASASGTTSDDTTVVVGLPPNRTYENPEMVIELSSGVDRLLIELALGQGYAAPHRFLECAVMPITLADRAADLLAAGSTLIYLRSIGGAEAPEAKRLADRIRILASELVASQSDDGGWSWIGGSKGAVENQAPRVSDPAISAFILWALDQPARLGLVSDPAALDRADNYLTQSLAQVDRRNLVASAAILHALSTRGKATFEQANSLNRLRDGLPNQALAYLALAFANLDRASMGGEVVGILSRRARTEPAGPGKRPRTFWTEGAAGDPAFTTGLAALAFARLSPGAELAGAVDWLQAHRVGEGWSPHKAKGPAMAALAKYQESAKTANERYTLVVKVNGVEVHSAEVQGGSPGKTITVPARVVKPNAPNRVEFDIEGRGAPGYSVLLTGFTRDFKPDQSFAGRDFLIRKRVHLAADPELEGRPLPSGFGVSVNTPYFENKVTQVPLGGRAKVRIDASRTTPATVPAWQRDFLVIEERLPAGVSLIQGSVQSQAALYTVGDGSITFYYSPEQDPGTIQYEVFGYLPGDYRALPTRIVSAYDPGKSHLGETADLKVLVPGKKSDDPYKATPDELYARGKALYDMGRKSEASDPLEELFAGYALRDDVAKDAARMLLLINVESRRPKKIVQYFEVLKIKSPELVLSYDVMKAVARAYRDIQEYERAFLVWRAIIESSYLEDAKVGETLRQRGKTLEAAAYLLKLWREYPNTESIAGDLLGLSQLLSNLANRSLTDPAARRELLTGKVSRVELIQQSMRLLEVFLAISSKSPLADEASLAMTASYLDLENDKAVVELSERFAKLYPKSKFVDSFLYSEALGRFHLGEYDRAVELAERISKAVYKDPNGNDIAGPNKWEAIYILGQIFDARRQTAKALPYYEQVKDRFSDAETAVRAWKRTDFRLDEVTTIRPKNEGGDRERLVVKDALAKLSYRNIAEADVKVYPVDLLRLYLTKRNLNDIAGIDLAGVHPLVETKIPLGSGADYEDKTREITLPVQKQGAYLVMARGGERHSSGIVLVSRLEMEVVEEPDTGRVRITVRDALTKNYIPKVQVKVIGSQSGNFISGATDLRGVFLAEGVAGQVTAIAKHGDQEFAFYRGKTPIGPLVAGPQGGGGGGQQPGQPPAFNKPARPGASQSLEDNLKMMNSGNQLRQMERLQYRYNQGGKGVEVQNASEAPNAQPQGPKP